MEYQNQTPQTQPQDPMDDEIEAGSGRAVEAAYQRIVESRSGEDEDESEEYESDEDTAESDSNLGYPVEGDTNPAYVPAEDARTDMSDEEPESYDSEEPSQDRPGYVA